MTSFDFLRIDAGINGGKIVGKALEGCGKMLQPYV